MIRGYVSSDEDDYEDYDFGYSEPLILKKDPPSLPEIQTPEIKEKLYSALKESQKIELFLKAVDDGNLETVDKFLSEGLSAESTDLQKWTPLMRACGKGNSEMVQLLLDNGADPNKHRELFTSLMTCCMQTLVPEDLKLNCVRLLLEHGAQVNAKDKYRTTALMYAAESGYENIVSELLEVPNIDVNIQDKDGWTALFHAVNHNLINIVNKLVSAKTNLKLKDKCERTALTVALNKDLKEVAKILGYVEEIPRKLKKKKRLRAKIFKQLPDSKGQGGFTKDSKAFLSAFNLMNTKKIGFSDLLNASEEDLYKIGITLEYNRLEFLSKGVHRYHLHPWKTSSMQQISWGVPLSLEDVINIIASLAKHLTIANASLRYFDTRISSRQNTELVDLAVEKETIIFLIKSYKSIEQIKILLQKIILSIEKIKPEVQGDYIYSCKNYNEGKKLMKFFWSTVGAATVGFLIFYYRSNPHFRTLMRSFYSFSSLSEAVQSEIISDSFYELFPILGNGKITILHKEMPIIF